jgi:hypothetical protein
MVLGKLKKILTLFWLIHVFYVMRNSNILSCYPIAHELRPCGTSNVHVEVATCTLSGLLHHPKANFTLDQATKAQRGSRVIALTLSLTSAQDAVGGEHHAPAALPPGKRPGTHCIGDWVGPKADSSSPYYIKHVSKGQALLYAQHFCTRVEKKSFWGEMFKEAVEVGKQQ